MTYSATDGWSDLTQALNLVTPEEWEEDGREHVSEETDLALAEIARLQRRDALATELATALERAESFLAGFEDCDNPEDRPDMLPAVRDAIAKAKGGG